MRRTYETAFDSSQLINAIKSNNISELKDLLEKKDELKLNLNQLTEEGDTPLIIAARLQNREMVIILLKAGADPYIDHIEGALPRILHHKKDTHEALADLLMLNNRELPLGQNWFFADRIPTLGYFKNAKEAEAACFGVAHLGMQAVLSRQTAMFNLRHHLIYDLEAGATFAETINEVEKKRSLLIKSAEKQIVNELKEAINKNHLTKKEKQEYYNKIRARALETENLSLKDRALQAAEIPIYLDSMVIYQKTSTVKHLFPRKVTPQDTEAALSLVTPLSLDAADFRQEHDYPKQNISSLESFTGVYTEENLKLYFKNLRTILNKKPPITYPISIILDSGAHAIQVGYDPNIGWIFINANQLKQIYFKGDEDIAKKVFEGFFGKHSKQKVVSFSSKVYVESKHEKAILDKFSEWHQLKDIKEMHEITEEKARWGDFNNTTWLFMTAKNNQLKILSELLDKGAPPNQVNKKDGISPLFVAAQYGHFDIVNKLIEKGALIDQPNNNNATPLFIAAQNGYFDIVTKLIEKGALINQATKQSVSPLYIASQNGHIDIVKSLLDKGALVDQAINIGTTPLLIAAQLGHSEIVKMLLEKGAKIDQTNTHGSSPLYIAVQNGHVDVIKILIKNGAKLDQIDQKGLSPLFVAAQGGHFEIVKFLCDCKADMMASMTSDIKTLRNLFKSPRLAANLQAYLKENGISAENESLPISISPIAIAKIMGHTKVAKYLESRINILTKISDKKDLLFLADEKNNQSKAAKNGSTFPINISNTLKNK